MPSYKFESESDDSDADEHTTKLAPHGPPLSDEDDEPGPDDTFQFRHSFSNKPRPTHAHAYKPVLESDDLDEPSFATDQGYDEPSYEDMQDDSFCQPMDDHAGSFYSEEIEEGDEEDEEAEYTGDPLAATVRIEKRATWLEQLDFTDPAVKRLNAIDAREQALNTKIHWGGRLPDVKYSTEDLERDLFGEGVKVPPLESVADDGRRRRRRLIIYMRMR
jgi:hypothetical protein